jgi:hypothetical protein
MAVKKQKAPAKKMKMSRWVSKQPYVTAVTKPV